MCMKCFSFFFLLMISSFIGYSQITIDSFNSYTLLDTNSLFKKDNLYAAINETIATTKKIDTVYITDSKIVVDDKLNGLLIYTPTFLISTLNGKIIYEYKCNFTFRIKDSKYKLECSEFVLISADGNKISCNLLFKKPPLRSDRYDNIKPELWDFLKFEIHNKIQSIMSFMVQTVRTNYTKNDF